MYWRIRKITPEMVARQYSIHAFLIVSVLFNVGLFSKVAAAKSLNANQKEDMTKFGRSVSQHIFDANYLTFQDSMQALVDPKSGELYGPSIQQLRADSTIPRSPDELKTMARQLSDTKSVSCIKFYAVDVGNQDQKGYVPIDVKMKVVVHDTTGVRPNAIKAHYIVAFATNPETKQSRPVVLNLTLAPYDDKTDPAANGIQAGMPTP